MGKKRQEDFYTRASALASIDVMASELGQDLAPMLKRFGLSTAMLADPDTPISYQAWCDLLETCAADWKCPDFGLQLGALQNLNILGLVGLVVRLTDTVGEALRELEGYMPIHSSAFTAYLDEGDTALQLPPALVYEPRLRSGSGRQMAELSMSVCRNVLAMISGVVDPTLLRVTFKHPAPKSVSIARGMFKCPVSYGQARNALYFDARLLELPTSIKDLSLAPIVRSYLEKAQRHDEFEIGELTSHVIGKLLVTGRCTREVVADCLRLHPRTLQRRLGAAGTSFSELFDEQRHRLAMDLVSRQSMPLAQVASTLGFSDQSSFNQAFRRWTGASPTWFRKA